MEVAPAVTSTKQIYSFGQTTYRRTPNGGGKNELKSAKRKVCEGFQFIRTHRVVFKHNFDFSICNKKWKSLPPTINKVRIYWLYVYNSSFWWKSVSEEKKCFSLKRLLKLMFVIKNQGPVMAFFIKVGGPSKLGRIQWLDLFSAERIQPDSWPIFFFWSEPTKNPTTILWWSEKN